MPFHPLRYLDALFLPLCLACDEPLNWPEAPLCPACRELFPPAPADGNRLRIRGDIPGVTPAYYFWSYEGPVRRLILRAKERPQAPSARYLARELRRRAQTLALEPGGIIAVPPARRRRWRGWHLSRELAAALRHELHWPAGPPLRRRAARPAQASLDGAARRRNLVGSFAPARTWLRGRPPPRVWIVDDVVTTGATMAECARVLAALGVAHVGGIALAGVDRL